MAPLVAAMRHTTAADLAVLVGYVVYFDVWKRMIAAAEVEELGSTARRRIEASAGDAYRNMMAAVAKLGFSPSDRTRVREIGAGKASAAGAAGGGAATKDKSRFFPRLAS